MSGIRGVGIVPRFELLLGTTVSFSKAWSDEIMGATLTLEPPMSPS
jgi:hypothetical protein